jgi:hypothetical protein
VSDSRLHCISHILSHGVKNPLRTRFARTSQTLIALHAQVHSVAVSPPPAVALINLQHASSSGLMQHTSQR